MEYPKFKNAIKKAIKTKGLSLRALSRETGIDLGFLSRILSGQRNPPSNSYIIKIANILDLNPDQLIVDAGRIPKRAVILLEGIATTMKPAMPALEEKGQELLLSALDYFFSTEEGKKWFLDDYEIHQKHKSLSLSKQSIEDSFALRALSYFGETPEGMRWIKNEFKRLKIPKPDLRTLYKSINKRTT
jgi:transcriptional regulator with XRE-family HTH domain